MVAYGGKDLVTPGRQTARRRAAGQRGGGQGLDLLTTPTRRALCRRSASIGTTTTTTTPSTPSVVMDFDGTLSTEVAMWNDKAAYNDMLTSACRSATRISRSQRHGGSAFGCPEGREERPGRQGIPRIFDRAEGDADYLKVGLGRFLPRCRNGHERPWWPDPKTRTGLHRGKALVDPTVPSFGCSTRPTPRSRTEHVWGLALADVMVDGMTPKRRPIRRSSGSRRSSRNIRSRRAEGAKPDAGVRRLTRRGTNSGA